MARSSSMRANPNWQGSGKPKRAASHSVEGGKPKRAAPEARLQMDVKRYLTVCLPEGSVKWTASMAGANLSMSARTKAKATGVQRGWPDLQFLFPDGVTRYIELKAGASLSPEQREFRDYANPLGVWALCRSLEEVVATLRAWGAPLREREIITLNKDAA